MLMLTVNLFGPTRVRCGRQAVALAGVKPRRLVQMLAADLGNPVAKDVLAETLWDGRPPKSYVASIESYACVVRRALAVEGGPTPLVTATGAYLLDPERVQVDLVEVRSGLEALRSAHGETLVAGAEEALRQMTGRLLAEEPFGTWADRIRERHDELTEIVVTEAAETALGTGQYARAMRLAQAVLQRSALSEPACRTLMRAYRGQGARAQALAAYADLRALMLDELGVEPCERTRELYLAILDDAGRDRPAERDGAELSTLVRLLRETLASGVRPDPLTRTGLAELGRGVAALSA
jgi:DNA-binding SARP family transcriptional activator